MASFCNKITELLASAPGLRRYGYNIVWLFSEKVFRILVGFTVGIYVARQLGPSQYGLLNYAISFCAVLGVVATLGLDAVIVRELTVSPEQRDRLLGTASCLRGVGSGLMLGILAVIFIFSSKLNADSKIVWVVAVGYLFQSLLTANAYFQAKVQSKFFAISQMIAWAIVSLLRLLAAYYNVSVLIFAALESLNMFLIGLFSCGFYVKHVDSILKWRFDLRCCKKLLAACWPLILSGASSLIYLRTDQLMITQMLGEQANGNYAVAVRICEIWYIIPTIICSSLFTSIVGTREYSNERYLRRLKHLLSALFWGALLISVAVFFCCEPVINLLFGEAYSEAAEILKIYVWRNVFVFVGVAFSYWLVAEYIQYFSLVLSAIGCVLNIILNFLLINSIGILGAAWATLITNMLLIFIALLLFPRLRCGGILLRDAILLREFWPR